MEKSLPKALWDKTLDRLISKLGLTEENGADGGPYMDLISQLPMVQGSVGNVRVFKGDKIHHLITCSITVAPMQLDSHMLFVFSQSDTAVPHFTLDSVLAGDHNAFHLDLIPRVDLGSNLPYMNEVFVPLTETCETVRAIDGMEKAHISPLQFAVMSPWMLVHRATDEAFGQMEEHVNAYMDQWLAVLENGVSAEATQGISANDLVDRDGKNKAMIFDPAIDPVWGRIEGLIGAESVLQLRTMLMSVST